MSEAFNRLTGIMTQLRSEQGCPWDREQTHETLRPFLIEEAYEVLEAIDDKSFDDLKEELGDLLLQVVFHAQVAEEDERFNIEDVLEGINDKLIRRHPHVFGDVEIKTSEEQRKHWEKLKKQEGKKSVLDGVPYALPALNRANRIQQKAASIGFDWERVEQVWDKVHEEMGELQEACAQQSQEAVEEEFGDLLFALVNLSRFLHLNTEDALRAAINKFIGRFHELESEADSRNMDLHQSTLEELDAIWNQIKNRQK